MKRKFVSVLLALVLVLSFSLVTATPAAAADINVPGDYATIQLAIDNANPGDEIIVAAGTYTEDPVINMSLTLSGPNAAINPNTGTRVTEATVNGTITFSGVNDDVTIQGFSFNYIPASMTYSIHSDDSLADDDLVIQNNIFTATTASSGSAETAIYIGPPAAIRTGWVFSNNLVTGYRGMFIWGGAGGDQSTVTISNNVVGGTAGTSAYTGISVDAVTGTISGNTVSYTADAGINVGSEAIICDALTISTNTVTYAGQTGTPSNAGAINLHSDCTAITITRNTLSDSYEGISIKDAGALGAGTTVYYNDISGNTLNGINNLASSGTLAAMYNYWGDPSGPDVTGNDRGTGDSVTVTTVTYEPWLHTTQATVYPSGVRYYAYNWCDLTKGWNIWSTPIALDAQADTWGEYKALGNDLDLATGSNAYYFTSSGTWASPGDSYELEPCDALYIKMASDNTSPILFSSSTSVPSKALVVGWNLVSASYIDVMDSPTIATGEDPETVLASVFNVPGPYEIGYSQVVSPAVNQGTAWSGVRLEAINSDVGGANKILPCKGYWVYMTNGGTLAGTVFTPVSPLQ